MVAIILSSKIIESNLKVEFGDILPVELPIQNKQLLTHQIESLGTLCEKVYLTIPKGYISNIINDVTPVEMDPASSLMDVFRGVSRQFGDSEKLFIYYGDSLFLDIQGINPSGNYFFVQKPIYQYGWGLSNEEGLVPAGGIIIDNQLFARLLENVNNFDELTNAIQQTDTILSFSNFEWLDFGHTLTYYYSRKRFLESRSFNRLNARDGFIIKSSSDKLKMACEYAWLEEVKKRMPANVPYVTGLNISGNEASYSIEYINHPILSDMFVFGKLSEDFFLAILGSVKIVLQKFRSISFEGQVQTEAIFLVEKLKERQEEIIQITADLQEDQAYIGKLLKDNIDYFSGQNSKLVPMHGDLCFSNILFNFSTFEPVLLDPRGYTSAKEGASLLGPEMYDIYKLAHSYVLGYDFLIAGLAHHPFFEKKAVNKRMDQFCGIFESDRKDVCMGLKNLFLSMLPLHTGATGRQHHFIKVLYLIDEL